jgi:hypothetical protein
VPLVISRKGRSVHYVRSDDDLTEILGSGDFEGKPWAVGDRLIFEDGTESIIVLVPDGSFHAWGNPMKRADLDEVRQAVGRPAAESWEQLFDSFRNDVNAIR